MFRWFLEIGDVFDKSSSTELRKNLKPTCPEAGAVSLSD